MLSETINGFSQHEKEIAQPAFSLRNVTVSLGKTRVLEPLNVDIPAGQITAIMGPSGCGKSTLLKSLNRMLEVDRHQVPQISGTLLYHGIDIMDPRVDPVEMRKQAPLIFQQPTPFPSSIYENIALYARLHNPYWKSQMDQVVQNALERASLWDEVKERLKSSALALSGGQQQRLCIARALALQPPVLLLDEPCSSLDPIATQKIEDTLKILQQEGITIIIVTHNTQQSARLDGNIAFISKLEEAEGGRLIEFGTARKMTTVPQDPRTEEFMTIRFQTPISHPRVIE